MDNKSGLRGRGNAGFGIPFLIVIIFGSYLLSYSHVGDDVEDFGNFYQGKVSYISRNYFCIETLDLRFYLHGFSDREIDMTIAKLRKECEICFYATESYKRRSKVLQIGIGEGVLIPYCWWRQNLVAIIFVCSGLILIPISLRERKRIIRKYGASEDPSMLCQIVTMFRRYQRPFIDDERTEDKSVNEQKATKK